MPHILGPSGYRPSSEVRTATVQLRICQPTHLHQNGRRGSSFFPSSSLPLLVPGTTRLGRICSGRMESVADSEVILNASRLKDVSVSVPFPLRSHHHTEPSDSIR